MPQLFGIRRAAVQLEAVFAGVAGARDEALRAGDLPLRKVIVRNHCDAETRELAQERFRLRTLHREQRGLVRDVAQPHVGAPLLRDDCVPVLLNVRSVDDHHQLVLEPVDQTVVDERSFLCENTGVLRLAGLQRPHVVARDTLDEGVAIGTRDLELAHVRDVEHAHRLAHRFVLRVDTGRIRHRHLEAGEGHHLGAECDVHVVEGGALERGGSHVIKVASKAF